MDTTTCPPRCQSSPSRGRDFVKDFFIEFDGAQLTVSTDVKGVEDFVRSSFRHMLVAEASRPVGVIEIAGVQNGFVLNSTERLELESEGCEPLLPYLKEEIVVRFMRARPDLLWMHAGAVARLDGALLIAGSSGQGKSTLTTMLCDRGWQLMSDDVAPVRMIDDMVLPFYQSPTRRLDPGRDVAPEDLGSIEREGVEMVSGSLRREPATLQGLLFPRFERNIGAEMIELPAGTGALELLRHARNIVDHRESAVERAAAIARSVPMFQLCYGNPAEAVDMIRERF